MRKITEIPKLAKRPVDGHKGTFGKVLIIGGSVGFSGAASLAGTAALRSGAGLVCVAVPQSIQPIVATLNPCYTTLGLNAMDGQFSPKVVMELAKLLPDNDAVAFGIGAGVGQGVKDVLLSVLEVEGLKLVIDADGLNVLAESGSPGGWLYRKKADIVLTPHPGEMKRLWKRLYRDPMPVDRVECAVQFAQKTGTIVVFKGAGTVVTDGERVFINDTGNPGMATAGSGDVLTGVVTALIGQGLSLYDASILGVHVHGLAGDAAAKIHGQVSMIATDIIDHLGHAFIQVSE